MFSGINPAIEGMCKSKHCQEQLKNFSSEELTGLVKYLLDKNNSTEIDKYYLVISNSENDLFVTAGAFNELQERHGREKALNLVGYRKPKTIRERLDYFFNGTIPKYEN